MRRSFVCFLLAITALAGMAVPAGAAKRVTVKQLSQALGGVAKKSDKECAQWLSGFEMTERVSTHRLLGWKDAVPEKRCWRQLMALADAAVFLSLPSEEVPSTEPLNHEAQKKVLALASKYVETTLSKLPNFFATQAITLFEDTPPQRDGAMFTSYAPLHYAGVMNANVLYRGGKEVMETRRGEVLEAEQTVSSTAGLLSSGEFGPVLKTVLADAQQGKLTWSHWEMGKSGPIAVFRYSVVHKRSHYKVKVLMAGHSNPFDVHPGYHGEIGLDPETGTILRLILRADLSEDDPLSRADLMVEYGPVEIGARTYICPVKSVAVVVAYPQFSPRGRVIENDGKVDIGGGRDYPMQMMVNDVAFEHYQLLRSEAKILTGADLENDKEP